MGGGRIGLTYGEGMGRGTGLITLMPVIRIYMEQDKRQKMGR